MWESLVNEDGTVRRFPSKGDRVRIEPFLNNFRMVALAGMQFKGEVTMTEELEGVLVDVRGDKPDVPDVIGWQIKKADGEVKELRMSRNAVTHVFVWRE